MKKLNLFFVAAATLATAFTTSCKDPEFAAPEVVFTNPSESTLEVAVGSDYTFKGTVTSADSSVTITEVQFLNNEVVMEAESVDITADGVSTYNFEVKIENIQEDFTLKVVAYDSDNKMSDASVEVTTVAKPGVVLTKTAMVLGNQNESEQSFMNLASGTMYSVSQSTANQASVDLVYYWGASGLGSFYSPSGYDASTATAYDLSGWSTKHTTKFIVNNTADYDNITYSGLTDGAASATLQGITNIAAGNKIFFKDDSGRSGLIKVNTISQTKGVVTVAFDYKVQQDAPAAK